MVVPANRYSEHPTPFRQSAESLGARWQARHWLAGGPTASPSVTMRLAAPSETARVAQGHRGPLWVNRVAFGRGGTRAFPQFPESRPIAASGRGPLADHLRGFFHGGPMAHCGLQNPRKPLSFIRARNGWFAKRGPAINTEVPPTSLGVRSSNFRRSSRCRAFSPTHTQRISPSDSCEPRFCKSRRTPVALSVM